MCYTKHIPEIKTEDLEIKRMEDIRQISRKLDKCKNKTRRIG